MKYFPGQTDKQTYKWLRYIHYNSHYQGSQFLIACHETALASVYSNYYWSQGQQAGICMPIFRAIWHVFRYVKKGIQSMVLKFAAFSWKLNFL